MSESAEDVGAPLIRAVDRQQMTWRPVDVEELIEEDHPARAIWELVGRLNLSAYQEDIKSRQRKGGRPAVDPQLLISLWVYAYSQGVGSAREVARRCEYQLAYQWLAGLQLVNYHTLADFRVGYQKQLDDLFTEVLGLLSAEGLITLDQVTQDGTKIKALASGKSFHRKATIERHLEQARKQVAAMGDPCGEGISRKAEQARKRARREREERLQDAVEELTKLQAEKKGEEAKQEARVSISDPEARKMKQPDGGFAPSYNVQISTDTAQGMIVAVAVTQARNDSDQLIPAVDRIEARLEQTPKQMVADGDYTNRNNVQKMAEREIDFLGSLGKPAEAREISSGRLPASAFEYDQERNAYICPEGKILRSLGRESDGKGGQYDRYEAAAQDCQSCPLKPQCCPGNQKRGRGLTPTQDSSAMIAFREKMATESAQVQYKHRGPVAEFCHAWIKDKLGLRQFHVRGMVKATLGVPIISEVAHLSQDSGRESAIIIISFRG